MILKTVPKIKYSNECKKAHRLFVVDCA